jgi:carotenoid cleavage dioxygenase-like enzyme
VRAPTLDTVGVYDWHKQVQQPVTAHPKVDPDNGEMARWLCLFVQA